MNVQEIVTGILKIQSAEDIKIIQGALNIQLSAIQTEARKSFTVGNLVSFKAKGVEYVGRIAKINQKTVVVQTTPNHKWRVSPSLLTKVEG